MTSQITARSWNYILKAPAVGTGAISSRTTRSTNHLHVYRSRINPQECSHRRKLSTTLSARCHQETLKRRPAHCAQTTTFVVCNHNLSTFSSGTQGGDDRLSSLSPCGRCNILGPFSAGGRVPPWQPFETDRCQSSSEGWDGLSPVSGLDGLSPVTPLTAACSEGIDDEDSPPSSVLSALAPSVLYPPPLSGALRGMSPLTGHQTLTGLARLDANWVVVRAFHSTPQRREESKSKSKAEDTVKALKEEAKAKQQSNGGLAAAGTALSPEGTKAVVQKKSLWHRFVAELKHYYHGFRLLFIDVRVCARYMWNVLMGRTLSRRERRQLVRTTADLFRLVPFLVFIVVPFMEFLLPVALKLFPGMLPSTFNEEKKEQEALRKKLKGKLEMAKFLQDTIEEMALLKKGGDESRVIEFTTFLKRIRSSGEQTTNEEIIKYSKLFKDEITLDSLDHGTLVALCKLLDLQTIGTNAFLRFQLRMKLRQLEADDRMIKKEGMDSLTVWELQEACRARGMRSLGVSTQRLQSQLQQWLDLHLDEQVPASLLLLSRTLYLPTDVAPEVQLKATLSALPETMAEEAKVTISEVAGERVDNKTKLEIIRQEEQAIQEERLQTEKEAQEEEAKKKEETAKAEKAAAPDVVDPAVEPLTPEEVAKVTGVKVDEVLVDKATEPAFKTEGKAEPEAPPEVVVEEPITVKELEEVEEVLEAVAEERERMKIEQEELETLKEDVEEYKENLEDLKEVVLATGGALAEVSESKAAQRLSKQVDSMVHQMEGFMASLQDDKDQLTEEIEVREVRIKRSKELQEDTDMRQEVLDQISTKKDNLIGINELLLGMKRFQKISDDTKIQRIAEILDEDKDGQIDIDDALKVIDVLGRENVKVDPSKMPEILELLRKEAALEEEAKKEKESKDTGKGSSKEKVDGPTPPPGEVLGDKAQQEQKQP